MAKKKKKNGKKWLIGLAVLTIVALVIYSVANKDAGVSVSIGTPSRETIIETIPANGKIQPVTEVKISPDVSGEIIELNVKEGDRVKKGDLLIKIKQDVYISAKERTIASLNSSRAQYLQQEASLKRIELSYNRNKMLYEQKAISQADFEASQSEFAVAKEQLKAAEYNIESASASLKEAEENLIKTTIYSPIDGTVSKLSVEKGERVVGTSQMAGTEMLRIANLNEMEVLVDVNENDIIRIKDNDTASIEVDAYPGRTFKGVVTQIANSAKNIGSATEQVTNFEVKVKIVASSYQDLLVGDAIPFRPGMSASVLIETSRKDNILTIPLQSITTRKELADENEIKSINEFVFVLDEEKSTVNPIPITTGIQDINRIEVISGLDENTKIVTGPYNTINNTLQKGDKVIPTENK